MKTEKHEGKLLQYRGFVGSVEFDLEDKILFGHVLNTRAVLGYHGETLKELEKNFKSGINDYLASCKELKVDAEKPFSGKVVLRMKPDTHKAIHFEAGKRGWSLNQFICNALESVLAKKKLA